MYILYSKCILTYIIILYTNYQLSIYKYNITTIVQYLLRLVLYVIHLYSLVKIENFPLLVFCEYFRCKIAGNYFKRKNTYNTFLILILQLLSILKYK